MDSSFDGKLDYLMTYTADQLALQAHIQAENAKTEAWIAEDPENRFAGIITDDLDHWAGYGVKSVDQYERYMLEMELWDAYKEVNGYRPRHMDMSSMSVEELQSRLERLYAEAQMREAEAKIRQHSAIIEFEQLISVFMSSGAGDRETALRWIEEAEGDDWNGWDHYEYFRELPDGYVRRSMEAV